MSTPDWLLSAQAGGRPILPEAARTPCLPSALGLATTTLLQRKRGVLLKAAATRHRIGSHLDPKSDVHLQAEEWKTEHHILKDMNFGLHCMPKLQCKKSST